MARSTTATHGDRKCPLGQSSEGRGHGAAAIRQTVVLPAGSRIDLRALPQCQASDDAISPAQAAWLTTPPTCPRSGHWISRGTFQGRTAAEGGQPTGPRQVRTDMQRCKA